METVTDQNVHRQRAAAFTTLAQLADQHGLPLPLSVSFLGENSPYARDIHIRLDDNRRGSVEGWAKVLGLSEIQSANIPDDKPGDGFVQVKAQSRRRGQVWLEFDAVEVWSACDRGKATQPSEYSREIDNGDPDAPIPPGVVGEPLGDSGPDRHTDPKDAS